MWGFFYGHNGKSPLLQVALLLKLFYGSHVISIQNKHLQQMNNIEYQAQLIARKIIQKYFH